MASADEIGQISLVKNALKESIIYNIIPRVNVQCSIFNVVSSLVTRLRISY